MHPVGINYDDDDDNDDDDDDDVRVQYRKADFVF
jgi:hypothetical protein